MSALHCPVCVILRTRLTTPALKSHITLPKALRGAPRQSRSAPFDTHPTGLCLSFSGISLVKRLHAHDAESALGWEVREVERSGVSPERYGDTVLGASWVRARSRARAGWGGHTLTLH